MKSLLISNFKGLLTDVEDTHMPNNSFKELVNYKRRRDGAILKIPGYTRWSDYVFNNPINEINYLKKAEGDQVFCFTLDNIYRINADMNVSITKQNYPANQTEESNSNFKDVRSMAYQNRLWCVDENVFPFVVYNESDETGINLNVFAKLQVDPTFPHYRLNIIDFNDNTIIYDTIDIPAIKRDDTNFSIEYNDGANIYIFSDTWVYKFNYGSHIFNIVIYKQLDTVITDKSFKDTTFGIYYSDDTKKGYDYIGLDEVADPPDYHWYDLNFATAPYETKGISHASGRFYMKVEIAQWSGVWRAQGVIYVDVGGSASAQIGINAKDIHGNITQSADIKGPETFVLKDPAGDGQFIDITGPNSYGVEWEIDLEILSSSKKIKIFKRGRYLYQAVKSTTRYNFGILLAYLGSFAFGTIKNETGTNQEVVQHNIKKFDLDNNLIDVVTTETWDDILNIIGLDDYDTMLMDTDQYTPGTVVFNTGRQNIILVHNGTPQYISVGYIYGTPHDSDADGSDANFINEFKLKNVITNPEQFNPYIYEYDSEDWEVKMLGTPGRPVGLRVPAGSLTGTYRFYISYVTTLDVQSETYKSQPSSWVVLTNEDVDVYWAVIPTQYYEFNFIGLRIYVEDQTNLGQLDLVKEVADPSADWTAGHVLLSSLTPIIDYLQIKAYFPKCELVGSHLERLVLGGSKENPNTLYYSEAGDPYNIQLTSFIVVKEKDKDFITGYVSIFDRLIIFKNKYIYAIVGDLASPQGVLMVSQEYGCIASDSIVVYKNTIIFLSYAGICLLEGNKVIEISRDLVNNWIFAFDNDELRKSKAVFDVVDKEYRLFIKDKVLVYNLNSSFYIEDKVDGNSYTSAHVLVDSNNKSRLLFASNEDNIIHLDKTGDSFNGRERFAYLKSKKYKLSDIEDLSMMSLLKLNAQINSDLMLFGDKDFENITPKYKNYYQVRVEDFCNEDVQFALYEQSYHDLEIFDMELISE